MMKLCFPHMRDKPGPGASIINTASKGGIEGTRLHAAYAAAKESIRGLSRVVSREWGEFNIRVSTVSPGGWTDNVTSQLRKRSPEVQEWAQTAFKDNPFGRIGDLYDDLSVEPARYRYRARALERHVGQRLARQMPDPTGRLRGEVILSVIAGMLLMRRVIGMHTLSDAKPHELQALLVAALTAIAETPIT
jgi:NAD(P)-dependent dehydrogenase (short-subunit alcohol dehydrogenase family)